MQRYQGPYVYFVQMLKEHEEILEGLGYQVLDHVDRTEFVFRDFDMTKAARQQRAKNFAELCVCHKLLSNLLKASKSILSNDNPNNCKTVLVALHCWYIEPVDVPDLEKKMKGLLRDGKLDDPTVMLSSLRETNGRDGEHGRHYQSHGLNQYQARQQPLARPSNSAGFGTDSRHPTNLSSQHSVEFDQMREGLPSPDFAGEQRQVRARSGLEGTADPTLPGRRSEVPPPAGGRRTSDRVEEAQRAGEDYWEYLWQQAEDTEDATMADEDGPVQPTPATQAMYPSGYGNQGRFDMPGAYHATEATGTRPHPGYSDPRYAPPTARVDPVHQQAHWQSRAAGQDPRTGSAWPDQTLAQYSLSRGGRQIGPTQHAVSAGANPAIRPPSFSAPTLPASEGSARPTVINQSALPRGQGLHTVRIRPQDPRMQAVTAPWPHYSEAGEPMDTDYPSERPQARHQPSSLWKGGDPLPRRDTDPVNTRGARAEMFSACAREHEKCDHCKTSLAALMCHQCGLYVCEDCFNTRRHDGCGKNGQQLHRFDTLKTEERYSSIEVEQAAAARVGLPRTSEPQFKQWRQKDDFDSLDSQGLEGTEV